MVERPYSGVQSVERAIAILKAFSLERPERGVGELARELGLHKSTVSRLMRTLERGGLLAQNADTRRYRLGIDLIGLSRLVVTYLDVRDVARPVLRRLAEVCQETVNLAVLDGGQVIDLDQFVPHKHAIKISGWGRWRMPLHCTASGKVLLAYLPPDELQRTLPPQLERLTPHTVTDIDALLQELEEVRLRGYAFVREELEEGLNAIAVPIYDHTGQVPSSVNVAGPAYRVTPERFPDLTGQLLQAAAQISRQLGYSEHLDQARS